MYQWNSAGDGRSTPSSTGSAARGLLARVGRALARAKSRPRPLTLEPLESRTMLEGSFATAIPIILDPNLLGSAGGAITPASPATDNDFYSFVAPGGASARTFVSLLADTVNEAPASTLNTRLQVFAETDLVNPIAVGTNNGTLTTGPARDGWAGFVARGGTRYFVVVSSDTTGGAAGSGTFTLRINAANKDIETVDIEGDATDGVAQDAGTDFEPIRGEINRLQEDVLFRFVVPDGDRFNSLTTFNAQVTQANLAQRLDSRVDIYRQSSETGAVTLVAFDSDAGRINDAFTTLRTRAGDVFFVRVRSDEIRPNVPTTNTGNGVFWLLMDAQAGELPTPMDPITRRGSDPGGAMLAMNPSPDADNDNPDPVFQTALYRFTAQGTGLTIITATPRGIISPVSDPALRVLDENGNVLAFNDNFAGVNAQLLVALVGGKQYYIIVDGFEVNSQTDFSLFVESHHTFDPLQPVDDHTNGPDTEADYDVNRIASQTATPLVFAAPRLTTDANDNIVRDITWRQVSQAVGRKHFTDDTDLFMFTPPVDMLGAYQGNNDDVGTSLFVGGLFTRANNNPAIPTVSRGLSIFDAGDWWPVGRQNFDANGAQGGGPNVQYGMTDNINTPATDGAIINAVLDFDPTPTTNNAPAGMTDHLLVVAGDFTLVLPPPPGQNEPVLLQNIAVWRQDFQTGEFFWSAVLGIGTNGPVHALASFTPTGPGGPFPTQLAVGGEFTLFNGGAASNAVVGAPGAFQDMNVPGPVFSMLEYNPVDPGAGEPPAIGDPEDPENHLFVGGQFAQGDIQNFAAWDGAALVAPRFGVNPTLNVRVNGPVFAMTKFDPPPQPAPTPGDPDIDLDEILVIGGRFTSAGGTGVQNLAYFGVKAPDDAPPAQHNLTFQAVPEGPAGGANATVFALATWNPPELNGAPSSEDRMLVVGGSFGNHDGNLGVWDGGEWRDGEFFAGTPDAPVRALATSIDEQEPGIESNLRPQASNPQEALYVGGDFVNIATPAGNLRVNHVVQVSAVRGALADSFAFVNVRGVLNAPAADYGPTVNADEGDPADAAGSVRALAFFDDGNPLAWDRHDRPSSRLQIVLNPEFGSFLNTQLRVLDSNFNVVFDYSRLASNTIAPPNQDPSGMLDPATQAPGLDQQFAGIELWGGEVYYIEVRGFNGNGGSGRYRMTVTIDAIAQDVNADGTLDDPASVGVIEEVGGLNFPTSRRIATTLATGDGTIDIGTLNQVTGQNIRQLFTHPSTPMGDAYFGDLGNINSITDTDLYNFRAEFTGFVEIRVQTRDITDTFGELFTDFSQGTQEYEPFQKTYNSMLDSALRIFDNDFTQIAYNDDNLALEGEFDTTNVGGNIATFYRRDARVVIPVVAGNVYWFRVESGQLFKNGAPADAAEREVNVLREIDWRHAIGSYQVLLHQMPFLATDVVNGQTVQDDHVNAGQAGATVIPIGSDPGNSATNGTATFTGTIRNSPQNPVDSDFFTFLAPGSGQARIRATATSGSLAPQIVVFDANGQQLQLGSTVSPGIVEASFPVVAGQKIFFRVFGNGGTEGNYRIDISGMPAVDDVGDFTKWSLAKDIPLLDYQGRGTMLGRIEAAGETDVFRFQVQDFATFTVDVEAITTGFDPFVEIFEVNEDGLGFPVITRIAFNNDVSANSANARTTFSVTPNRRTSDVRDYPFYYVVVRSNNLFGDVGDYRVVLSFPQTDDHADATLLGNLGPERGTDQYADATSIPIDPLTGGGNGSGLIERSSDSDLFSFTAAAGGLARVTLTRPDGSLLRGRVTILADGQPGSQSVEIVTAAMPDAVGSQQAEVTFVVTRGTRYLIVVDQLVPDGGNANTTDTGAFNLTVVSPPVDDHANAGEWALATNIAINPTTNVGRVGGFQLGDPLNPRLNPTNDTDLFTFTARANGDWRIDLTPFGVGTGTFAGRVTIFSSAFVQLFQSSATLPGQQLTLTIAAAQQGQVYYILVESVTGVVGAGSTGEYQLLVTGPSSGGGGGGGDPSVVDFNNPKSITLSPRTGAGSANDSIEVPNARDLFTFVTPAYSGTAPVFIQVVTPDGSLLDATIRVLRNPNELASSEVFFDADGLPGVTAAGSFFASGATRYWIVVDGVGAAVGSYEVRVSTQPGQSRLFFPEGYANDKIRETIAITNPNSAAATYTINIYYEFGTQLLSLPAGTVGANSTIRVELASGPGNRVAGLRTDVPYSIEIVSDLPLGATMSHYDFNGGLGDPFTTNVQPTWNFARVERNPNAVLDFVVFHNPNAFDIEVTLTAYQAGRAPVSITRVWGANRRGGWAMNDVPTFPNGIFSVQLTSRPVSSANQAAFEGVVASLSHYDLIKNAAVGSLGDQGSTLQVVPSFTQSASVDSEIVIYNPGNSTASVSITGNYLRVPLTPFARTFDVAPRSQIILRGNSLGLVQGQPIGLRFQSATPVSVYASQNQKNDADASSAPSVAGSRYFFGDGFINTATAGLTSFETLNLYNPTSLQENVNIRLLFADGTTSTFSVTLNANSFSEVRLHERNEIVRDRSGSFAFGVDATSTLPFVMTMTHYDPVFDGGWTTTGTPFGLVNTLSRVNRG